MAARNLVIVIFPALAAAALSLSAQVPDDLSQARALERQFEKIIADAEPSIACILVSRNSTYRKFCPQRALAETPALNKSFDFYKRAGELGRPDSVDRAEGLTEDQRAKLKNEINLKNPTIVPESFGSGIVIDPGKGLILTNFHVVRDAVLVYVRLPEGKGGYANIYAADPRSDLAVLKIDPVHTKGIKQPIRFGDAAKLRRGQFVLTLANPYAAGFRDGQPSASWGILSNIRRRTPILLKEEERVKTLHHYGTLLQLDARLNLGCSGGAVFNLRGEMVGLTTSYAAIEGGETPGGYAVPLDACFTRIVDLLKAGEEVEYGFLGVRWNQADVSEFPGTGKGVRVKDPIPGSPAHEARLKQGDRIKEVAGVKINDVDDLFLNLGAQLAGTRVEMLIETSSGVQKREEKRVEVTLAKMYMPGPRIFSECKTRPFDRGLRVEYTSVLIRMGEAVVESLPAGVLVDEVTPGSAAAGKLRPGDVIKSVNGRPVASPAAYAEAVRRPGPIELVVGGVDSEISRKVVLP